MSGGSKKGKKKKILNSPGKEISRSDEEEDELTESTAMATPNASFDSISKQIQAMQKELKIDLKTVKDDNTTQVKNELAAFKEDINQKLVKINADVEGPNDKVDAALTRTEEVEQWSTDAKRAMKDILKEQKIMMDKLDDLESRSRRNNMRIYSIPEDAELRSESVVALIDKWLKDKLSIETDLKIQRAHQALAPKPKTGQPPRPIILHFQQLNVKE
jgi:chromosome segregation ATPase